MKPAVAFLMGCLMTGTVLGVVINSQKYINDLRRNHWKASIEYLLKQRDTCQAKFGKETILYQQPMNLSGAPTRNAPAKMWAIPADVQPVYLGSDNAGLFTHFDAKTMVETGKMLANVHSQNVALR